MKTYFILQYKIGNRKLTAFGLPPLVAYLALPILFILFANYLFSTTALAGYILLLVAFYAFFPLTEVNRNAFLKTVYNSKQYQQIRLVENGLISLPFILLLAYHKVYTPLVLLLLLGFFTALFSLKPNTNFSIPTPFSKNPFEFCIGFRKTYFLYPLAYFLAYMAIRAHNFNLGVFALIVLVLVCLSYYNKPEEDYFVWIFKLSPKQFLKAKITIALKYYSLLALPIVVALGFYFKADVLLLLVFFIGCLLLLATVVLAKYAAYPKQMNLAQGILITVSLVFPPLLLVVIPHFYKQGIKNLNTLLHDPS